MYINVYILLAERETPPYEKLTRRLQEDWRLLQSIANTGPRGPRTMHDNSERFFVATTPCVT